MLRQRLRVKSGSLESPVWADLDVSESTISSVSVQDPSVQRVWLRSSSIEDVSVTGGNFLDVDCRDSDFDHCVLADINAERIDAVGAQFHGLRLSGHVERGGLRSATFSACTFRNVNFLFSKFKYARFTECTFESVQFINCDLSFAAFTGGGETVPDLVSCRTTGLRGFDVPRL